MHPAAIAAVAPDRPAIVMGDTGEIVDFATLDARSNQVAHALRSAGAVVGSTIAIVLDNQANFLVIAWAAQRAGLLYTAVNRHLSVDEIAYIVNDSEAQIVLATARLDTTMAIPERCANVTNWILLDGAAEGWTSFESWIAGQPTTPVADECEGDYMLYSSGTTGKPKGIRREPSLAPMGSRGGGGGFLSMLGMKPGDAYLCPAPLYHTAPLAWSMMAHRLGGTVVVMEHFDPRRALELIARYRITHAQFVPTMFVRMLKLPDDVKAAADTSSLVGVVHAAAPCPVEVKRQMLQWWGPVIHEYYGATEGLGMTFITADEWLTHEGSVGKAVLGTIHVCDENGNELSPGETGSVYFDGGLPFEYHNDAAKTHDARSPQGWATVGDIGHVDEEGYLYLTDRKAFMIISGGVNIYPREAEDVLILHPAVADVAVFGVPHDEMGEEVVAVVQPAAGISTGRELEHELLDWTRQRIAAFKCPRSISFQQQLPRSETGKLYKRELAMQFRRDA